MKKEKNWRKKVAPEPCPVCHNDKEVFYMYNPNRSVCISCLACGIETEWFFNECQSTAKKEADAHWKKMRKQQKDEKNM